MRKGIKRLSLGILLGLIGVAVIPGLTIYKLISENEQHSLAPFKVPGEHRLDLTKPGKHTVWHYQRTFFEGQNYRREKGIPNGWVFTLTHADGECIPLESDESATYSSNGMDGVSEVRNSFLTFEIERPGAYDFKVVGEGEEHILKVAPAFSFEGFSKIMGAVLLSVITILSGIGLGIWGIVVLIKDKKKPTTLS